MTTELNFDYFTGPVDDMSSINLDKRKCDLCDCIDVTFELDFAICGELGDQKDGKHGCVDCLKNGRFEFWHDTDIGLLDENGLTKVYNHNSEPPNNFPDKALAELRRTPQIVTWQQELWLTHCCDFMVYIGTWEPPDFNANSQNGDGRSLFMEMTDEYKNLWDDSLRDGETNLKSWHATYYAFKCRHCGKYKGNWDCD